MTNLEIKTLKDAARKLYPSVYRTAVDHETGDVIVYYTENCGTLAHQHKKKIRVSNSRLVEKREDGNR